MPEKFAVDSNIVDANGRELSGYPAIANAQMESCDDKIGWFKDVCSGLRIDWNTRDYIKMNV